MFMLSVLTGLLVLSGQVTCLAHQPNLVGNNLILIDDPEISRAYYGELKGRPAAFFVRSPKIFKLYAGLLVPQSSNPNGRFSATIYAGNILLTRLDQAKAKWQVFHEPFANDDYLKGPEYSKTVPAGEYVIEVFNRENKGKYVLAIGDKEYFGFKETAAALFILPQLKRGFFKVSPFSLLGSYFALFYLLAILLALLAIYPGWRLLKRRFSRSQPRTF
jgi:hypothetical protein